MKVCRKNIFETNSSSTHSLSTKRNKSGIYDFNFPMNNSGKVPLIFGRDYDFGWGYAEYNSSYAKLNYLACMAFECHNQMLSNNNRENLKNILDVLRIKDIQKLEKVMKENVKNFKGFIVNEESFGRYQSDGWKDILYLDNSIDHQSWEDYKNIDDFLKKHKVTLANFLFNPAVKLIISNDNSGPYDFNF